MFNRLAEVSGGAVYYTGRIQVQDTLFEANEAVREGFAIISLGVIEPGDFSNTAFVGNVPHCPAGQYGFEEELGKSVRTAFGRGGLDFVCVILNPVKSLGQVATFVRCSQKRFELFVFAICIALLIAHYSAPK